MAFVDLRDAETVRRVKVAARRLLASGERPDVQGLVAAYKKIGGELTKEPALVVLVDRKPIEKSERAPPIALVPPGGVVDAGQFLRDETFGGASLLLDVQAVGALRPQPLVA